MTKKVSISPKPKSTTKGIDSWVNEANNKDVKTKMKRLTIDIPEDLHREIKSQCAQRGTKIADEVRGLLFEKYTP